MPRRRNSSDSVDDALHVRGSVSRLPTINPAGHVPVREAISIDAYVKGIISGDRTILARAITLIESENDDDREAARRVLEACMPGGLDTIRIGITGSPGVGKSTLIETLGIRLTRKGRHVAVLAVDPSSEMTGGSILGDKTRMPRLSSDPNAFIRPSPAAGSMGGVARATRETLILCEAAGYDVIFVETVGVGQSETTVHSMVDFFMLLTLAGAGDDLQGIKRGIIEWADAIIITKADGSNVNAAKTAQGLLRSAINLYPPKASGHRPKALTCSSNTGDGLDEILNEVKGFIANAKSTGDFAKRRQIQSKHWFLQAIENRLHDHFTKNLAVLKERPGLEKAVRHGTISPFVAADELHHLYLDNIKDARQDSDSHLQRK